MNIYEKLSNIQNELKAPKGQYNKFGGYKYRSCEDILEAVKPICKKYNTVLVLSDEIVVLGQGETFRTNEKNEANETTTQTISEGQRFYIKATATLYDIEISSEEPEGIENTAYAREEESKKGMDGSQITGTASSYARKYALNGLFNIDDTKDADTDEFTKQTQESDDDKIINNIKLDSLNSAIEKAKIKDEIVEQILQKYNYSSTDEIKMKDYMNIINEFKKITGGKE